MRLIFAMIVAAATLATVSTPAFADDDGERAGDHSRRQHDSRGHDSRGQGSHGQGNGDNNRDNNRWNNHQHGRYQQHHDRRDFRRRDYSTQYHYNDSRGARYWGPSARQWSRWDNNWGDPHRYARQWGFDRYDHNRGWQRGNTWYSSPNQWSDWGGWSWSFSVGNGSYENSYNNGYNSGYYQHNAQCNIYRTQDWVNGRRAVVTYQGCADRWGQVFEQPGTRRVEQWGW